MAYVRKLEMLTGEVFYTPGGKFAVDVGLCKADEYFAPGKTLNAKLEESATALKLRLGYVEDVFKREGYLSPEFTEVAFATLDKTTGKVEESDSEKILSLLENASKNSIEGFMNVLIFAVNAAAINNSYAYQEIKKSDILNSSISYGSYMRQRTPFLYWMMVHELDYFEKLLKTSKDILMFNIDCMGVKEFLSKYKENAIPSSVLMKISELEKNYYTVRGEAKKTLIKISQYITQNENGNNAKLFIDWIEGWLKLSHGDTYRVGLSNFAENFYKLLTIYRYDSKHLTDYLTRQSFYYGDFSFPSNQVTELADYLQIAKENGLHFETYPAHVQKAHNCIISNKNAFATLSAEAAKKFSDVCAENEAKYATKIGDYVVTFPKNPKDLFFEGASLNHCVGGYVSPVMERQTIIAFLRKKETPEVPLYTIEIKEDTVIQAKGNYNADVPSEIIDLLHQIEKRWSTRTKKALKKGEEEDA